MSDLHLLSLDGATFRDFLNKRVTGGVNLLLNRGRSHRSEVFEAMIADLNEQGVDHVACTGDITNLALRGEFDFARRLFDQIDVGHSNVTCVPGNHDNYVTSVVGLFEKMFAGFCSSDEDFAVHNGDPWPLVRVRGNLAIIGISSSMPTGWLFAHGRIGGAQLAALERALGDPRLADKCRVIMLHHPPAGKAAAHRLHGLRDAQAFRDVLGRTGAELVLCGHEHRDLREEIRGPNGTRIPMRCIPSGTYDAMPEHRRARYRIYTIETEGSRAKPVSIETRVFANDDKGFVADPAAASTP